MTGCEWNPKAKRGHVWWSDGKPHAFARVSLKRGAWLLCAACAALPEFKRYRVRKSLKSNAAPPKERPNGK